MSEEEFIRLHPGMKGKVLSSIEPVESPPTKRYWVRCVKGESEEIDELTLYDNVVHTKDVHETQRDIKVIEKAIDSIDLTEFEYKDYSLMYIKREQSKRIKERLKKELGID